MKGERGKMGGGSSKTCSSRALPSLSIEKEVRPRTSPVQLPACGHDNDGDRLMDDAGDGVLHDRGNTFQLFFFCEKWRFLTQTRQKTLLLAFLF